MRARSIWVAAVVLTACGSGNSKGPTGAGGSGGEDQTGGTGNGGARPGTGGATASDAAPPQPTGGSGDGPTSPDTGADPTPSPDAASPPPGMFSNPAAVKVPTFPDRTCPVAAGAGTAAVNSAIASCSDMGGGVVTFAAGTYALGSIHLKSNVKLQLNGATLRASGIDPAEPYTSPIRCQDEAHSHFHNAFLWGENLSNIAIVGPGTLDGAGISDPELQKLISLRSSSVMLFENFNHTNTGHFAYLLTDCHHVTMAKLTIKPSRDGVDLMECTDVNAHDLTITGGPDDAFALKSDCTMGKPLPTDNITVTSSTFGISVANALQIGSETFGDFSNITWSNIKVTSGPKSGIGIQMNDGAVIKNVLYENVTMTNTSFPIFLNTTSLLRGPNKMPGHAENIRFRNITASNIVAGNNPSPQNSAIVISGQPGILHQGIVLEQVKITFPGGGKSSGDPPEGSTLKSDPAAYNPRFITPMPAYGLFMRHAQGVELRDVKLDFTAAEQRPAVIARDVDGLVLDAFGAEKGAAATLELDTIKNLTINGSAPLPDTMLPSVSKMSF
jgi:hypothetical protein